MYVLDRDRLPEMIPHHSIDNPFQLADTNPWPAIIVQTYENTGLENDEVNLKVFADGSFDMWATMIPYSEENKPGTWHWPEMK